MSTYDVQPLTEASPCTIRVVGARSGDEAIKLAALGRGREIASVKAERVMLGEHSRCNECHAVIFPEDFCYGHAGKLFCKFHARAARAAALASKAG